MGDFKNIFLHYLNKDTQEIFAIEDNQNNEVMGILSRSLYASILLCADYCIIPLGFYFECQNTKQLIQDNLEFIFEGYLRISLRESDVNEYVQKKQCQLMKFAEDVSAYRSFYNTSVINQVSDMKQAYLNRDTQIGQYCIDRWLSQSYIFMQNNTGDMTKVYNNISNRDDLKIVFDGITSSVEQSREGAFVWRIIDEKCAEMQISDRNIKKFLRNNFEKYYYQAYLDEYNADILENIGILDRGIHFDLHYDTSVTNYGWYWKFLQILGLETILEGPAFLIIALRRMPEMAIVNSYYLKICNDTNFKHSSQSMGILTSECLLKDDIFRDTVKCTINKVKNLRITGATNMFIDAINVDDNTKEESSKVDVLILIATSEEEKAILNNDTWTECAEDENGFSYFVKDEGVKFALVRAGGMREGEMSAMGQRFIDILRPQYIAMAGFCAGRKGKVELGDVVVADTVYRYGEGKEIDDKKLLPEMNSYKLSPQFLQKVQRFGDDWIKTIKPSKPVDLEKQRYDILKDISQKKAGESINPVNQWKSNDYPDFPLIKKELIENQWITVNGGKITVLQKGKDEILELLSEQYWNGYKDKKTKIVVGSMACGDNVEERKDIFNNLINEYDRKTVALDMESHSLGILSSNNKSAFLVAKGVGDYAGTNDYIGTNKAFDNRYIEYACVASCRFVIEFFKKIMHT